MNIALGYLVPLAWACAACLVVVAGRAAYEHALVVRARHRSTRRRGFVR